MKKIFLILLFCILSFNILGQNLSNSLYYITLDLFYEKLHEEEILKRTKFKWQWSDGECTEGILESGFYNKYIVKCIFQFDNSDKKEQELCEEGITHIWGNSIISCNIFQYKVVTKLISQKYEGNYYCASETLAAMNKK
jgi:hypothetical protein